MEKVEVILRDMWEPTTIPGACFYAIVFFIIAMVLSRVIRLASKRMMLREDNALVDRTVVMFLTQLAQIGVYIVGLIIFFHIVPALNRLGTALLTGVSVMSVVFGLAAQNTLSNLVAGCTLLLYRPFHIDDLIQVATPTGTEYGIVERLTLGYTMLRTLDDRLVIVPNSLMASQVSLNLNRRSLHAMAIVPVAVIDLSHIKDVRDALMKIAEKNPNIHRIIACQTQILEDGGAILSLRAWCANESTAKVIEKEILDELHAKFSDQKIIYWNHPPIGRTGGADNKVVDDKFMGYKATVPSQA